MKYILYWETDQFKLLIEPTQQKVREGSLKSHFLKQKVVQYLYM